MAFHDLALSSDGAKDALIGALESALPSEQHLATLAKDYLGLPPKIGKDLPSIARQLLQEAEANSAVRLLLRGARAMNCTNEKLIEFEAKYTRRCFDAKGEGTADGVRRLDELIKALGEIGEKGLALVDDVLHAVTNVLPPAWSPLKVAESVVLAARVSLIAEQDGWQPPLLLQVVREIQRRVGGAAVATVLGKWARAVATSMGVDLAAIRPPAPATTQTPRYLMVRVKPTQLRDGYLATAWLWTDGEPNEVWRDECRDLDAIRDALSSQLERRGSALERGLRNVPDEKITYEFVLPRNLIDAEVDRWAIGVGGLRLGALHRVVVRSYERIYEMADRGWTKKWVAWESRTGTSVAWFDPEAERPDEAFRAKLAAAGVVALASLGPFASGAEDPLTTTLKMGVPIVVWPRRACPDARAQLEALVKGIGDEHADACQALLELRRRANDDQCTASRHAALLWDDARRPPPDTEDLEDVPIPGE
jgi:hypothetical protein